MDIKDSYLHGTVGVVKSISVDADILSYRLADVAGTTITVTMPTATQEANGLLSSDDKKKLDNMIATQVANDLILKINSGTIEDTSLYTYNGSADKTLDIKEGSNVTLTAESNSLTIAASDTKVTQTNTTTSASYRVLFSESANNTTETATVRKSSKLLFNPNTGTLQTTLLKGNVWGTLYTERGVIPSTAGNVGSGTLGWFTASSSSGYAGDSTGFPVNSNANGILWLGTHGHGSDSTKIGYGHLLGFSSNGNIYHRPISNGSFPTTDNGSSWKQLAFTDSNITGNAASADKLKTARKLWGLDFDGTADVKGSLTEVTSINMNGDIVINDGTNHDCYIKWLYNNTDSYGWRIGYLGSKGGDNNDLTFDSHRKSEGWASALYFKHTTLNAHFAGIVIAPTFQGNLDGVYVNMLTGYSKATSGQNIEETDTLNIALGKVEYKSHFAYDWITAVTAPDADEYINKWGEIVGFLDSVKEGTDILDEFVTRKTALDVTGLKTFLNQVIIKTAAANKTPKLTFNEFYGASSNPWISEIISDYYGTNICTTENFTHGLYIVLGRSQFDNLIILNSSKSPIARISKEKGHWFDGTLTVTGNTTSAKFITSGGTSTLFVKGDGSLDDNKYLINTHATHTSAYYRTANVNGVNYAFWSHTSNNAFTIYAPIGPGDKGLVLISKGSGAPEWGDVIKTSNYLAVLDIRDTTPTPNDCADKSVTAWFNNKNKPSTADTWYSGISVAGWNDGYRVWLLSSNSGNGTTDEGLFFRGGKSDTWSPWKQVAFTDGTIATANNGIFYIEGTGSTAGTWLGSHTGISSYYKGLTVAYKIPIAGASTTTLNINDLGAKTCYINTSKLTTHYGVGATAILVYDGTYFRAADYWDGNNYAYVRQYTTDSTNNEYPLLFRYNIAAPTSNGYVTEYTRYDSAITVNPSTGNITATSFTGILKGGADHLNTTEIIASKTFSLSSSSWTDTGYTFANLSSGTYAVQVTSGSNLVASGIMSIYKNLSDTIGDEIPLHVYGTASWRPYLRTYANKLLISSNDVDSKSRVVTIKIAKIL